MPGDKAASVFDRVLSRALAEGYPFEHARNIAGAAEARHRAKRKREDEARERRRRKKRKGR